MTTEQDINEFTTKGGIKIRRETAPEIYEGARMLLVDSLESVLLIRQWKFLQSVGPRAAGL